MSAEVCCACGGGQGQAVQDVQECVDSDDGATDTGGDPCSGYYENPSWCNGYDDEDFVSAEVCCACGGGQGQVRRDLQELQECVNTDYGATDTSGDPCSGYTENPSWCNGYDDEDFVSSYMCCACGGGGDAYTLLLQVDDDLIAPAWLLGLNNEDKYVWDRLVSEQLLQGNMRNLSPTTIS